MSSRCGREASLASRSVTVGNSDDQIAECRLASHQFEQICTPGVSSGMAILTLDVDEVSSKSIIEQVAQVELEPILYSHLSRDAEQS